MFDPLLTLSLAANGVLAAAAILLRRPRKLTLHEAHSLIVENLPAGVVYVDEDSFFFNRGAETITGYKREDVPSLNSWFVKLFAENAGEVRQLYEADKKAGFPSARILSLLHRDGTYRVCEFSFHKIGASEIWLILDSFGHAAAAERTSILFDYSLDPHLLLNPQGVFDCNDAAVKNFGYYSKRQLQTSVLSDLWPERQPDGSASAGRFDDLWRFASKHGLCRFDWVFRRSDGTEFPAEVTLRAINHGENRGVLAVLHDLTERKAIAEALKESEERYSLMLKATKDGLWDWDVQSQLTYVSPRYEEMLGYPVGTIDSYNTWESLIHPDDKERVLAAVAAHWERRAPYDIEFRMRHSSGEYRWFHSMGQALWDAQGRPVRMTGYLRDISARKAAEEQLRRSDSHFERFAAEQKVGVWEWIFSGDSFYLSPHFEDLLGYPNGDFKPTWENFTKLVHPDDVEAVSTGAQAIVEGTRRDLHLDFRLQSNGGDYLWFRACGDVIIEADGRRTRIVGTLCNITDRRNSEQHLKTVEAQFQAITDCSPIGIFIAGADGNSLYESKRQLELMGQSRKESRGLGWLNAVFEGDRQRAREAWIKAVQAESPMEIEQRYLLPGGRIRWVRVKAQPVRIEGKFQGFVGTTEDISANVIADQALRESEERYALAAEAGSDGIWDWNLISGYLFISEKLIAITGYSPNELNTLEKLLATIYEHDRPVFEQAMAAHLEGGGAFNVEYRIRRKDGAIAWVQSHGKAHRDAQGNPVRMVGTSRDITAQKKEGAHDGQRTPDGTVVC